MAWDFFSQNFPIYFWKNKKIQYNCLQVHTQTLTRAIKLFLNSKSFPTLNYSFVQISFSSACVSNISNQEFTISSTTWTNIDKKIWVNFIFSKTFKNNGHSVKTIYKTTVHAIRFFNRKYSIIYGTRFCLFAEIRMCYI